MDDTPYAVLPKIPPQDDPSWVTMERFLPVLHAAPFGGKAWADCCAAFERHGARFQIPTGPPTLLRASQFLQLYSERLPAPSTEGASHWGLDALREALAGLGDDELIMVIAMDETKTWSIYLTP